MRTIIDSINPPSSAASSQSSAASYRPSPAAPYQGRLRIAEAAHNTYPIRRQHQSAIVGSIIPIVGSIIPIVGSIMRTIHIRPPAQGAGELFHPKARPPRMAWRAQLAPPAQSAGRAQRTTARSNSRNNPRAYLIAAGASNCAITHTSPVSFSGS